MRKLIAIVLILLIGCNDPSENSKVKVYKIIDYDILGNHAYLENDTIPLFNNCENGNTNISKYYCFKNDELVLFYTGNSDGHFIFNSPENNYFRKEISIDLAGEQRESRVKISKIKDLNKTKAVFKIEPISNSYANSSTMAREIVYDKKIGLIKENYFMANKIIRTVELIR